MEVNRPSDSGEQRREDIGTNSTNGTKDALLVANR